MMEQRSDEWFSARCGKVTASRVKNMMAKLKSGKPAATREEYMVQLAIEKVTGSSFPTYQNAAMQHGTDTEPEARHAYSQETGNFVDEKGFILMDGLDLGCSPDGLIGADGGVEIKCPYNPARHWDALKKMPEEHKWQIQTSLLVTNREWWDFVSYDPRFPEHLRLIIHRQVRDEPLINDIKSETERFLNEVDKLVTEMETK
jgi:putative phage-type endonuclease